MAETFLEPSRSIWFAKLVPIISVTILVVIVEPLFVVDLIEVTETEDDVDLDSRWEGRIAMAATSANAAVIVAADSRSRLLRRPSKTM